VRRFDVGLPYTLCGQICVSVNPFRWLNLYDDNTIGRYHNSSNPFVTESPHVYQVAHEALTRLSSNSAASQSILVSGESGAGKTENTKICMQYLAKVEALSGGGSGNLGRALTDRVLQSSPILEAFGNAQTVRNDNSSRFGKFLQLRYSENARQLGAHIKTYLLERSRLVRPPTGEANYHVLYALIHGATAEETAEFGLLPEADYEALTEGNGRKAAAMRKQEWEGVLKALKDIGFPEDELAALGRALAGVLALTMLEWEGKDGDEGNRYAEAKDQQVVARGAACLRVEPDILVEAFSTRRTHLMTGEMYVKQLDEHQSADAADALAKAVYGRMFDAVVSRINGLLSAEEAPAGEGGGAKEASTGFIGILDIFGFESFKNNSFEQLCINYANEVLQQQFNADVFKQQQIEYEAEGVPWEKVEFQDNAQVLLLLEAKRVGAFALLDEESRLQSGSAAAFVEKLRKAQEQNKLFSVPKLALKSGAAAFTVSHYAGPVTYDTSFFLIKNTDPLHPELLELMEESKCAFLAPLFTPPPEPAEKAKKTSAERRRSSSMYTKTIGARFKEGLAELMAMIQATQVHYIRCVKPNATAASDLFTHELVADQLRFAGMQEAVRISRAAYPHRMPRRDFGQRFSPLHPATPRDDASLPKLLGALLGADDFCLGKTKVFLRGSALPDLEERRHALCSRRAVQIQTVQRGVAARRYRARAMAAALHIERAARRRAARRVATTRRAAGALARRVARGFLARRRVHRLRRARAAVRLQSAQRRHVVYVRYNAQRRAAVRVQAQARMQQARKKVRGMLEEKRVRATYEFQLHEAATRLQAEANEKSTLVAEKEKLEKQLREKAQTDTKAAEQLQEELAQKRQNAEETSRLLKQQAAEVQDLRAQLEAEKTALKSEKEARESAERRVEQANLQLSMVQSNELKLQRLVEAEKQAAAAAKAREREAKQAMRDAGGGGDSVRGDEPPPGGTAGSGKADEPALRRGASSKTATDQLELDRKVEEAQAEARERESQLRTKLAHATNEAARARDKLRAMQDSLRVKSREWDKERTNMTRQVDNLQADLQKREQWLGKAKDIISEYQKRSVPGQGGGTPQPGGKTPVQTPR